MPEDIQTAQRELTRRVMGRPGVSGTAIGRQSGKDCLTVYVNGDVDRSLIPKRSGGFPVVVEQTGIFRQR